MRTLTNEEIGYSYLNDFRSAKIVPEIDPWGWFHKPFLAQRQSFAPYAELSRLKKAPNSQP